MRKTAIAIALAASIPAIAVPPAEAQYVYNRGAPTYRPIPWQQYRSVPSIRVAPTPYYRPAPQQYFRPMPNSTPMMVPRGSYVNYGQLATRGARILGGSYVIYRGYPTIGRVIRGGPAGILLYPSCVGEGCSSSWMGKVFP
jgi:hypothetical protein